MEVTEGFFPPLVLVRWEGRVEIRKRGCEETKVEESQICATFTSRECVYLLGQTSKRVSRVFEMRKKRSRKNKLIVYMNHEALKFPLSIYLDVKFLKLELKLSLTVFRFCFLSGGVCKYLSF